MTTSLRPSLTKLLQPLKAKLNTTPPRQFLPRFANATPRTYTTAPARFTRPRTSFPSRPQRRFNSTDKGGAKGSTSSGSGAKSGTGVEETLSLSQRLKKLSREYGWSALGVYLALSALDFPFCFAAVRLLGVERIGYYEHVVVSFVKDRLKSVWPVKVEDVDEDGQGQLAQAEERNQEEASEFFPFLSHFMSSFLVVY
jgi:hypothetical protein